MLKEAIFLALDEINKPEVEKLEIAKSLKTPNNHGFVDLVRYFLGDNYPPISFSDVESFLEVPQQ